MPSEPDYWRQLCTRHPSGVNRGIPEKPRGSTAGQGQIKQVMELIITLTTWFDVLTGVVNFWCGTLQNNAACLEVAEDVMLEES